MCLSQYDQKAKEDFTKARSKAVFAHVLSLLKNQKDELLSLKEVKSLVKPQSETYRGLKTVPISLITGSEGRYQDFNRFFLPRRQHLRGRWVRVDMAHYQQINLPVVQLYEIGGVYFVRDGNHRVSVAKAQGVEFIDAEVIALSSDITLKPGMTKEELKKAVIGLEKKEFFRKTELDKLRTHVQIEFSATGRYDEIIRHINGHKYYMNLSKEEEIPFQEGMLSWYDNIFEPIVELIRSEKILASFPGRTASDLYVWIVRHWDDLKRKYGNAYPLKDAAVDFKSRYGRSGLWSRIKDLYRRLRV